MQQQPSSREPCGLGDDAQHEYGAQQREQLGGHQTHAPGLPEQPRQKILAGPFGADEGRAEDEADDGGADADSQRVVEHLARLKRMIM